MTRQVRGPFRSVRPARAAIAAGIGSIYTARSRRPGQDSSGSSHAGSDLGRVSSDDEGSGVAVADAQVPGADLDRGGRHDGGDPPGGQAAPAADAGRSGSGQGGQLHGEVFRCMPGVAVMMVSGAARPPGWGGR
jgi:hypothetical protein